MQARGERGQPEAADQESKRLRDEGAKGRRGEGEQLGWQSTVVSWRRSEDRKRPKAKRARTIFVRLHLGILRNG